MTDDDDDALLDALLADEPAAPRTPLDRHARDALLAEYVALLRDNAGKGPRGPLAYEARRPLVARLAELRETYLRRLPRVVMSRCPLCDALLHHTFDPWGFDGLWWEGYDPPQRRAAAACAHFRLLRGAVAIAGPVTQRPWEPWDQALADLGGDAPHVIPRLLAFPGMIAVVAAIAMDHGHTAYPIAYFSDATPAPGTLCASWTESTYGWTDARGAPAWSIVHDDWDFRLAPWIERGRLCWIDPDDPHDRLVRGPAHRFPFPPPSTGGRHLQVSHGHLRVLTPPRADELAEPFE